MKRWLVFLTVLPIAVWGQVIVNTPREGTGEQSDHLRIVSTSTGSAVVGVEIAGRTFATGSRTSANSGAKVPTVGAADSTLGSLTWANLDSVLADDGKYARDTSLAQNDSTHYLLADDFGFELPHDAVVTGITATIEAKGSVDSSWLLVTARLVKAGTIVGSDYATNAPVQDTLQVFTYGGSDSLWGTTWTRAQVNDSAFGVVFQFKDTAAAGTANIAVDYIKVTVYWTQLSQTITADTTQAIPTFRGKSHWLYLSAKDSVRLLPQYQLSNDAYTWMPVVPMDSLTITTESYKQKAWNLSTVADSSLYIRYIFNFSRNAYAPGTTTATYTADYAIKRD